MSKIIRLPADRVLRLVIMVAAGLALGACSKCDVPDLSNWPHGNTGGAPASCHGDPPAQ